MFPSSENSPVGDYEDHEDEKCCASASNDNENDKSCSNLERKQAGDGDAKSVVPAILNAARKPGFSRIEEKIIVRGLLWNH